MHKCLVATLAGTALAVLSATGASAHGAKAAPPKPTASASSSRSAVTSGRRTALPDWSGTWKVKGSMALISTENDRIFQRGLRDKAPFKPEWRARYDDEAARAEDQGNMQSAHPLVDSNTVYCHAGMPRLVATPFDYNFVPTRDLTFIIVGGPGGEPRFIYTDGRSFPADDEMWPKFWGWSIGKWEGDTLSIETRGVKPGLWLDPTPMKLSDRAVVYERVRRVDAATMEDRVRIVDPVAFTRPWEFVRHYEKIPSGEWADEHEICGGPEDRNPVVNGRVTVVLPKQPDAGPTSPP